MEYSESYFDLSISADSVDLPYSMALHDAVMLYAHAATKVLQGDGQDHNYIGPYLYMATTV